MLVPICSASRHRCIPIAQETNRWGLSAKIKRKPRDKTKAHFSVVANARSDECYEWFRKTWNQFSARLSYVSSLQRFQVLVPSWAATKRAPLDTWIHQAYRKTFWSSNFYVLFTLRSFIFKDFSCATRREQGSVPQAARVENFFRNKITNKTEAQLQFRHLQEGRRLWVLQLIAKTANVGAAIRQMPWSTIILGLENTIQKSSDYLFWFSIGSNVVDQRSGDGWFTEGIEVFACWTRSLLLLWTRSSRIPIWRRRSVSRNREPRRRSGFSRGRQTAFMIYDDFRVIGAHDAALDYADLFPSALHDDNVQEFDTRWDDVLFSMSKIPSVDVLVSLHKLRIRESAQLKTILDLYDMEIHQKISISNCQKLKTMVKRSTDQKLRLRNFDARPGRIESGALMKNRKGLIGVEGGKGISYQWKEKGQCSQGSQCSFQNESNDRAQKPEHTAARLLTHQCHKVEVFRGTEVSEAKVPKDPFHSSTTV